MAVLKNTYRATQNVNDGAQRVLATDAEGMMIDAKEYAKRDISTVLKTLEKLNFDIEANEELIVKSLIAVKYEQIDKARNERPSYMSYFE
jgi:acetyl-CoA acetyltransferase